MVDILARMTWGVVAMVGVLSAVACVVLLVVAVAARVVLKVWTTRPQETGDALDDLRSKLLRLTGDVEGIATHQKRAVLTEARASQRRKKEEREEEEARLETQPAKDDHSVPDVISGGFTGAAALPTTAPLSRQEMKARLLQRHARMTGG